MAGPAVVSLGAVAVVPAGTPGAPTLRPGQILQGTIGGTPGNLELRVGSFRALLDASVPLVAGQTVNVTVEAAESGLRLNVAPLSVADQVLPGSMHELTDVLRKALDALAGGTAGLAAVASQLLPASLPASEPAVRALLSLLTTPGTLAVDLQRIDAALAEAVAAGVLVPAMAADARNLVRQLLPARIDDLDGLLRQWVGQSTQPLEARVHALLVRGGLPGLAARLREDLRAVLLRLRDDDPLRQHLARRGELAGFDAALARALERLEGGHLQNLRALEAPYLFTELPLPEEAPIRRAQVHFFGDGGHGGRGFDGRNATIALDLSTTRLGDLWVTLAVADGRCTCVFRVARREAMTAIEAGLGELRSALDAAGYTDPVVEVTPWDGDRLAELAQMMRRFSSVDVAV